MRLSQQIYLVPINRGGSTLGEQVYSDHAETAMSHFFSLGAKDAIHAKQGKTFSHLQSDGRVV
jgi:hypothetical protein